MRQLLTESVLLGLVGGAFGVVLAFILLRVMIAIVPPDTIPDEAQIVMNVPVLLFSGAVSVLTAVLFGLAPAWFGRSPNLANSLKLGGRGAVAQSRGLMRNALGAAEVALALVLLAGAAMTMRALIQLQGLNLGFPADRVLSMRVPLSGKRYPSPARRAAFFRDLLSKVQNVPGVAVSGLNTGVHPFGGWGVRAVVAGKEPDNRRITLHQIDPGYLRVVDLDLVTGRSLLDQDVTAAVHVALVNRAFVRRYFPESSALGATVRLPDLKRPPAGLTDEAFQIVGVVRDILNNDPKEGVQPEIYIPYTVLSVADTIVMRAVPPPATLVKSAAAQVYTLDRDQPVTEISTVDNLLRTWVIARPRFNLILFAVFAALGLILATVGVFGILSNMVSQRTQEIGLRIAMGATLRDVLSLIARQGIAVVGAGVAAGTITTYVVSRFVANTKADLGSFDLPAFGTASGVLIAAGAIACFVPALRAARIDPAKALRNE